MCRGPCKRFSGSRWVRLVFLEDNTEGLEFVLLLFAAAAAVSAAGAGGAGTVLGALSDG